MAEQIYAEDAGLIEQPAQGAPVRRTMSVVTIALIAINAAVFLAMVAKGVPFVTPTTDQLLRWGADYGPRTLNGQWWRILTSMFLHYGIIHVAMNMYILYQIGLFTEMLYGRGRILFLYLAAGLGGNIVSLYVHPLGVGAGASGAIFGLFGALLAFLMIERGFIQRGPAIQIAKSAGIFLGYNLIFGLANGHTDLSAHMGGLVTGFLVGCVMVRPRTGGPNRLSLAVSVPLVIGALGLGLYALATVSAKSGVRTQWYRDLAVAPSVPLGDGGKIIYTGSATTADATALARAITATGFTRGGGTILRLSKGIDGTSIAFAFPDEELYERRVRPRTQSALTEAKDSAPKHPWDDSDLLGAFRLMGITVAPAVGGPPIKVLLLDSGGQTRQVLTIDTHKLQVGQRDSVWYSGTATEQEAKALGHELQMAGLLRDRGTTPCGTGRQGICRARRTHRST